MSVFNGEYMDFFYAMFKNSKQEHSQLQVSWVLFNVDKQRCVYKLALKMQLKRKFSLFFCSKKIDLLPLSKACCFEILQVSSHSFFDVHSNSSPTLCSKLQIMSMGVPHHGLNSWSTPAAFENNFAVNITNGTSNEPFFTFFYSS